jgi:hypothetical protein
MAKTYNPLSNVTVGSVLTASDYNEAVENSNNFRVPAMCSLYRNAALSHTSNGNYQAVAWDSEEFTQTDSGMWASTPNPSRITLTTAGVYILTANASPGASATGLRAIRMSKNGSDLSYGHVMAGISTGNYLSITTTVESTGTDYVECSVFQSSGGNLAYVVGQAFMRFSAVWVGQAS